MAGQEFNDEDYWKGIILFGLNAATYKMALAKSLAEFSRKNQSIVLWDELAASFLNQYIERLAGDVKPQQSNPHRRTTMERVVMELNAEAISYDAAVRRVAEKGLEDVVPRFHTIGRDKEIAKDCFYSFDYGKKLILKDSLLGFSTSQMIEMEQEYMARWSLLEGAFVVNQTQYGLSNDIREIYLESATERSSLTTNIPFLSGYQGNLCFYCCEPMFADIHVDHVLPRQVLLHDEMWNLVLAHEQCNLLKSDKLVGPLFIEKLIARNENIMGSNHPWKHKISSSLGKTSQQRAASISKHYENTKTILGRNYWGGSEFYNPATDPFYRRLITVINNGNRN